MQVVKYAKKQDRVERTPNTGSFVQCKPRRLFYMVRNSFFDGNAG